MNQLPHDIISVVAAKEKVDPKLVSAIAQHESGGNMWALRYEPNYQWLYRPQDYSSALNISLDTEICMQKFSIGYMQLMFAVCRELGFKGNAGEMFNPETNFAYGCRHIKRFLDKYGNLPDALSAYNAGSPRKAVTGKYVNAAYVDDVMKLYSVP